MRWFAGAFRGARLAAGAAAVLGFILLANAAIGVLLLVFIAMLLASALETDGPLPARPPAARSR